MQVKDILFKNCKDLTEIDLPEWLEPEVNDNGCTIKSYAWKSDKLRRLRLCNLNLKGKFIAESLVIYPDWDLNNPVFGTEYVIAGGKRFFGTIDFHPLDMRKEYIDHYINKDLRDQPDRGKVCEGARRRGICPTTTCLAARTAKEAWQGPLTDPEEPE